MEAVKAAILRGVFDHPVDIAERIGYEKLTSLHNLWIRKMVFGTCDETIQAHRGSFKTTCLIVAFAYIIVLFPKKRTMFFRKTDTDVAEVMNATSNVLQSAYFRELARRMYGTDLKVVKSTQTEVSTNLCFGVAGSSQLLGMGCGGSVTGKHADFVFTDDIVTLRDRVSGAERERIKLFYQELQNVKNRGGKIFNTGTPWHKDDAFCLMPSVQKWDCYQTGLMTRAEIEEQRKKMTPSLFAANYELQHIADEEAIFSNAQMFGDYRLMFDGIGHIDASYGGGDGTAFTVVSERDGMYYLHIREWKKHVDDCLPDILGICKSLRVGTIYCETNADKGYLRKKIIKKGHPCIGYPESTNKFIKISSYLREAWERVRFLDCEAFPIDAQALNEILDYSEHAEHDDMPDSAASAIRQLGRKAGFGGMKEGV